MNKILIWSISVIISLLMIINCEQEPDYDSLIQQGLNSGVENNELFLDYKLGMTRDEFFKVSWEMNKEEKITGLVKIDYQIEGLRSPAIMRFYPHFVNDRISKMPIDVHYTGWAPWNHELSSDSLVVDLVEYYEKNLDTSFKRLFVPDLNKDAYVSVEGNRAITVYPHTEVIARVDFTDLNTIKNP